MLTTAPVEGMEAPLEICGFDSCSAADDLAEELGGYRRSARGLETRDFSIGSNKILVDEIRFDIPRGEAAGGLLSAGPSCGSYRTAAILMATAGGANYKVGIFRSQRIVAAMHSFAYAAGVRSGCSGCR